MAIYLTNKVFIVTGSASGIGLATAKHLLSRGASLALCDINGPALEKAVAELDPEQAGRTISGSVDITDRTAVTSFLAAAKQKFGKIDGIANVAGTGGHRLGLEHVWETSADEFDFIMNLNVRGLFNVLGEGLQVGYLEEPASIVHVGSMFSARGFNKGAVFSASKHAALGLVKSAAIEAGSRSIRVNTVMPCVHMPFDPSWTRC